ncbi:hypothetical protein Tco_0317768 [Tanacetum coccineum]
MNSSSSNSSLSPTKTDKSPFLGEERYFLEILGWVLVCALFSKKTAVVIKVGATWVLTLDPTDKYSFLDYEAEGKKKKIKSGDMGVVPIQ